MRIEERFEVEAPTETVWAFLLTPERVGPCIPGCEELVVEQPGCYRALIKLAIGPIHAVFRVVVEVTEERAPLFLAAVVRGEEGTRASVLTARNELHLRSLADNGTEIAYTSEVSVVGRLGKFGLGVMQKKAKAIGEEFAQRLRMRIDELAGAA